MIDEKKLIEVIHSHRLISASGEVDQIVYAFNAGLDMAIELADRQPKVNEWFPVEVVRPAEGEHVQVSYIDYNTGKRRCDCIAYLYNGLWYWQYSDPEYGEPVCVEITAWRTLGKPYMEEQKENDAA